METHRIRITRTARYSSTGPVTPKTRDVWIVCHGYGQLAADFLGYFQPVLGDERVIVAPEALSRFYHDRHTKIGASWMTREDREHEIEDYVGYLDAVAEEVLNGARSQIRLTALGFSQGAHTAARWAAFSRVRPNRLVLWGEHLPKDLVDPPAVDSLRAVELVVVQGRTDEYFPPDAAASHVERLEGLGLKPTLLQFDGGHRLDKEVLKRLTNEDETGRTRTNKDD